MFRGCKAGLQTGAQIPGFGTTEGLGRPSFLPFLGWATAGIGGRHPGKRLIPLDVSNISATPMPGSIAESRVFFVVMHQI